MKNKTQKSIIDGIPWWQRLNQCHFVGEQMCSGSFQGFFILSTGGLKKLNKMNLNKLIWGVCYFCHLLKKISSISFRSNISSGHSNTQKGKRLQKKCRICRSLKFSSFLKPNITFVPFYFGHETVGQVNIYNKTNKTILCFTNIQNRLRITHSSETLCYFRPFRIQERQTGRIQSFKIIFSQQLSVIYDNDNCRLIMLTVPGTIILSKSQSPS